jgi:hypothetical protein
MLRHRSSVGFLIVALALPIPGQASEDFPGVSKDCAYDSIVNRLRAPMFKGGWLQGEGFTFHDHSVFSDSGYADLLPFAQAEGGSLSLATAGLGFSLGPFTLFGLTGGVADHAGLGRTFGSVLLGAGLDWPERAPLRVNLYAQGQIDSQDGFAWEVGGHPLQTRWIAASVHASFGHRAARLVENRTRLLFLGVEWQENLALDTRRVALSLSRRGFALFFGDEDSSPFEVEGQLAWIRDIPRGQDIIEGRALLFFSTVGDGPRGEARPGIHLNLSYVSGNSSPFEGFGAEVGFGAKQIDTLLTQQLYFTVFYNYSAYFYRYPSLHWGLGLTGAF